MKELNWKLADGTLVIDRKNSHLASHLKTYPLLSEALPLALAQIAPLHQKNFHLQEVKMDKVVGESICVATNKNDEIVYAKRPNREGLTRFVKNRVAEESNKISVILKKGEGCYILLSAFVGGLTPPEPWDEHATPESFTFWNEHALIWGCEEIVPGTETRDCPW